MDTLCSGTPIGGTSCRMLIVAPNAGFANRLRTICGGILLSRMLERKCYHCWVPIEPHKQDMQNVVELKQQQLADYFDVTECRAAPVVTHVDICYSEWLPGDGWYPLQSYGQARYLPRIITKYTSTKELAYNSSATIMLESSYVIPLDYVDKQDWRNKLHQVYKECFTPRQEFTALVPNDRCDVGISIRRGDLLRYFPEANQTVEELTRWISTSFVGKRVWIFSCDHEFRDALRLATGYVENPITLPAGWKKGFVEFLTLATRCDKIYGTPCSSFAQEAAIYGNKPYATTM